MVRKTPLGISLSPFYASSERALREIIEKIVSDYATADVQICLPVDNKETLAILEEYFHIRFSSCCAAKKLPDNLAVSLPNTWLGSNENIAFEKSSIISILDFH